MDFEDPLEALNPKEGSPSLYPAIRNDVPNEEDPYISYPVLDPFPSGSRGQYDAPALPSAPRVHHALAPPYPASDSESSPDSRRAGDADMPEFLSPQESEGRVYTPNVLITISDPQQAHEGAAVPGINNTFITYLITTRSESAHGGVPPTQVRRRFSDFVALENLLHVSHRGYFMPPRPEKHVARGNKLAAKFVDRRRLALQAYIRRLASHRTISRSEELRVFLENCEDLRTSVVWASLQPPIASWLDGARRFLSQILGRERLVPAPAAAAQSTKNSNDLVRHVRERVYSYRHKEEQSLPSGERQLRNRSDIVRELASAVINAANAAVSQHRALIYSVKATGDLGYVLGQLGYFEETNMNTVMGQSQKRLGQGFRSLHAMGVKACGLLYAHVQVLERQSQLMTGVLDALHSREEALVTFQTLVVDIDSKRQRASDLQVAGKTQKVESVMREVAAAEAAKLSALTEYERVAARNCEELNYFARDQSREVMIALRDWAAVQESYVAKQVDTWISLARDLGADNVSLLQLQQPL